MLGQVDIEDKIDICTELDRQCRRDLGLALVAESRAGEVTDCMVSTRGTPHFANGTPHFANGTPLG